MSMAAFVGSEASVRRYNDAASRSALDRPVRWHVGLKPVPKRRQTCGSFERLMRRTSLE